MGMEMNYLSADFEYPEGFLDWYKKLHNSGLANWQQELALRRKLAVRQSHLGAWPSFLPPSLATSHTWKIQVPEWCQDQRNQMTGPADNAELIVKMLNSGAPGVMIDLEDSMANNQMSLELAYNNIIKALHGELTYTKNGQVTTTLDSPTVVFTRVRGLHMGQAGVLGAPTSASLFDLAMVMYQIDRSKLKHPLCFYLPKSESAEEARWWNTAIEEISRRLGWDDYLTYVKCMALVESHPLAYQMTEFIYYLRNHLIGLNLGRWDYMASLIEYNLPYKEWVLPDRNKIPHDVAFFQNLRHLMVKTCHQRGVLAIGGMTALYPNRHDAELNQRALTILAEDKENEAKCGMDGAWTGHPDQNDIAVTQFPEPNQLDFIPEIESFPNLRPICEGPITKDGTRELIKVCIQYRHGVMQGRGASLLDGYMEDLATDRICRLMIAQRLYHGIISRQELSNLFDQETSNLTSSGIRPLAGYQSENLILSGIHNPS